MATRLRELRDKLGYSQGGMAKPIGMDQKTWDRWENQPPAAIEHLRRIAEQFDVSADYLLGLVDDPAGHRDLTDAEQDVLATWRDLPAEQRAVLRDLLHDQTAAAAVLNTVQTLTSINNRRGRITIVGGLPDPESDDA